jgi:hypothetical protein
MQPAECICFSELAGVARCAGRCCVQRSAALVLLLLPVHPHTVTQTLTHRPSHAHTLTLTLSHLHTLPHTYPLLLSLSYQSMAALLSWHCSKRHCAAHGLRWWGQPQLDL